MPRMRRYATSAERQAAYRARQQEAQMPPVYLPALAALSTIPSKGRWKMAVDLAARLMQNVAEEMQTYSEERSEKWHEGDTADTFHERLDQVSEIQEQLDDLKASF
jgi:hypothetical protein